jgi:hypothetical protein
MKRLVASLLLTTFFTIRCTARETVLFEQTFIPAPVPIPIPAQIGAESYLMMLDTGSSSNAIDISLRLPLIKAQEAIEMRAYGKTVVAEEFHLPPISFGKWKERSSLATAFDFANLRSGTGIDFRGLLGMNAFQETAIDINFDDHRLRIISHYAPRQRATLYTSAKRFTRMMYLPLTEGAYANVPALALSLNGIPITATIDTGYNAFLGLNHQIYERLVASGMIAPQNPVSTFETETVAGPLKLETGHFTSGNLLGQNLRDWSVYDAGDSNILGMYFLLHYNFTIDFSNKAFYFSPRGSAPPIGQLNTLGLLFRYSDGHCHVTAVNEGATAKDADVKVGDEILKLNSIEERALNAASIYELCNEHAGETIDVEIARAGEPKTIQTRLTLRKKQLPAKHE